MMYVPAIIGRRPFIFRFFFFCKKFFKRTGSDVRKRKQKIPFNNSKFAPLFYFKIGEFFRDGKKSVFLKRNIFKYKEEKEEDEWKGMLYNGKALFFLRFLRSRSFFLLYLVSLYIHKYIKRMLNTVVNYFGHSLWLASCGLAAAMLESPAKIRRTPARDRPTGQQQQQQHLILSLSWRKPQQQQNKKECAQNNSLTLCCCCCCCCYFL